MNLAQNSSANVVIGPIVDVSGDLLTGLTIDNDAIWLVKEASVSAARNATTSALSVSPGHYRIVLNTTDTDTMGTLVLGVSASAALAYSQRIEVWQAGTHALFYGSANQIATSAAVSVIVSGVLDSYNVASAGELVTQAEVSTAVSAALTNYNVASAGDLITSAEVSSIVDGALTNYDVASSADVSVVISGVLASYNVASVDDVLTSAQVSAIGVQLFLNEGVNINRVNDVSVSGAGTTADPWRPA